MSPRGWVCHAFRPLTVADMVGCVALSLVELIQLLFPTRSASYVVVACALAALEANYSFRLVRARRLRGEDLLRFRIAEFVLFFTLVRVSAYIGEPRADIVSDLLAWPQDPGRVVDLEPALALFLVTLSWSAAGGTTDDLERIGEAPVKEGGYRAPVAARVGRFFWGRSDIVVDSRPDADPHRQLAESEPTLCAWAQPQHIDLHRTWPGQAGADPVQMSIPGLVEEGADDFASPGGPSGALCVGPPQCGGAGGFPPPHCSWTSYSGRRHHCQPRPALSCQGGRTGRHPGLPAAELSDLSHGWGSEREALGPIQGFEGAESKVGEAEAEWTWLPESFVEARYSTQKLEAAREGRVREDWREVKEALRSLPQDARVSGE